MDLTVMLFLAVAGVALLCFLGVVCGLWFQHQTKPDSPLQQVPVVPRATLPIHETNVRTIKHLKAASPEPLPAPEADPKGAAEKRQTRLQQLIRDTQTSV